MYPFPKGWNFGHNENTWATLKTADFDRNGQADLIRTSYIASHTDEQIDQVLDRFAEAGRKIGLIADLPPNNASIARG